MLTCQVVDFPLVKIKNLINIIIQMSKRKLEIHKSGEPMHVNKMHVNKMLKTDDAYHNKILDAVESVVIPFGLTLLPEKYTEKRDDYVWMSRLPMPDNPKCCAAIIKKLEDEKFSVPHTYMQYLYGVVEDDEESQKQNEYNNKILAAVQSVIIPFGLTLNKEVDSQKLGDYAWITRLPSPTDPKCCTAIIKCAYDPENRQPRIQPLPDQINRFA